MQMGTRYKHLQSEDRVTLASLRQQGWSIRAIARLQGRSPSTISRELRRNACNGSYASEPAQHLCQQRRIQARPCPKLHSGGALWTLVTTMLCWLWSPQQIARTLQRMYPQDPSMHASHESIYTAIYAYPRGELRRQLWCCCASCLTHRPRARWLHSPTSCARLQTRCARRSPTTRARRWLGSAQGTRRSHWHAGVLLRSAQAFAKGQLREFRWTATPDHAQGHRSERV